MGKVFFFFCVLIVLIKLGVSRKGKSQNSQETQTITPSEYCEGCKQTVDLYARLSASKLAEMQTNHVASGEVLDAQVVMEGMCDNVEFNSRFKAPIKYSCIKITQENATKFLEHWTGSSSSTSMIAKSDIFDRKKEICVNDFKACSERGFIKGDVPVRSRSKCSACRILAADLEATAKILSPSYPVIEMVESSCNELGHNHKPYAWIESHCDDIVEEFADEIAEILIFRNGIWSSGKRPDEPLSESMCSELFDCDESGSKSNRKISRKRSAQKEL